ncbi:DUF6603 domain-containing protein [Nocardiopsis quinghaiensis]|uniref:DUF6603 domain-containing protein n=1 Tax=Nocardiopsis quinghaiensis TaxID=464995 RepID=UPI0012385C9E|nr:DUF6603 domain-containing protein [Nocardiopsis quinghaiensis]
MTVTYGTLKSWLNTIKTGDRLDLSPNQHKAVKEILDLVEFSFIEEAAHAVASVITVTQKTDLSITGKLGAGISITVAFVPEAPDPTEATAITGIALAISLDTSHPVWGVLTEIGLESPKVLFMAEKLHDGAWKRLAVELTIKTDPKILVSCELGFKKKKPSSYRFHVSREDGTPFSLIDTMEKLGVVGVADFGPLLPHASSFWLDYAPGRNGAEVVLTPDSTDEEGEAPAGFNWGLAVLAKNNGKRPLVLTASFPLGTLARLSQLDLLKGQVPKDSDLALDAVNVVAATAQVPKATLTQVNTVLASQGAPPVPDAQDLAKGVRVSLDVTIVKDKRTLVVLGRKEGRDSPYAVEADDVRPQADDPAPQPKDPSSAEVQRALGPLHINRVGARLVVPRGGSGATRVLLEIDAALTAAGFELHATGLAIGLTITKDPHITIDLAGLGAGFSRGPVTVAGAIAKRDRTGYEYAYEGLLLVQATKWGLLAVGSYARIKDIANRPGYTSLFVFGGLAGKIAGPPPVVFTGLALGIGYNSKVRLPEASGVPEFPFIKALADMRGFAGDPPDPVSTLEKITGGSGDPGDAVVVPEPGNLWFTAGLAATIAETVAVQALLIAQFGADDFSIALLGAMSADFPPRAKDALKGEDAETGAKAAPTADEQPRVAHVELGFRALYEHAKRQLSLTAALSDNSWIVHPDCKLTGGAALYVWFPGSVHSGDFVGTVGGYHPDYHPPTHYPQQVPRLGVSWAISSTVSVKGELYVAVTPKVGMVGGRLSVDFVSGGLRAWLNAGFDAIVWWAPLYFDLRMWISIGASYTATVLGWDVTIRAEVGAYLTVWGPPTGGTARVEVGPFSKSIDFGEPRNIRREPLSWTDFRARQLPADPLGLSPVCGLLTDPAKSRGTKSGRWVVSTDGFSFSTRSALPATTLTCNGTDQTPHGQPQLKVGPMNNAAVTITQEVKVTSGGTTVSGWTAAALSGGFPMALWAANSGTTHAPPGKDEAQTVGYASGAQITAPPPTTKGQELTADGKAVQFEEVTEQANPLSLTTPEHNEDATSPEPDKDKARAALKDKLKRLNLLVEPV